MGVTLEEALEFRRMYEEGMTQEAIALETGFSQPTVRRHLLRVGTEMRPAGGVGRRGFARMVDGTPGKSERALKHVGGASRRRGHRRRQKGP